MDRELMNRIEAALFMSPGKITINELIKNAKGNVASVRIALNQLVNEYHSRESALEIKEDEGGYRMAIREDYAGDVDHLAVSPAIHKGILKTLAFISYKQPVKQSEVINFRNSKAYDHIKVLKEKGFIRKEKSGITYNIYTTKKFHQHFSAKKASDRELLAVEETPETISGEI
ncbi:MAG: SMC-Scp complex subunit ScpB [Candidatus Diapherotrites archaeon]